MGAHHFMAASNIDELALQLIQSYFERITAGPTRSVTDFPDRSSSNYVYVLYSRAGMPVHVGSITDGAGGRSAREAQALISTGVSVGIR